MTTKSPTPTATPPAEKPVRTLSYGVANPKQGGGKYRPAPAKSTDD